MSTYFDRLQRVRFDVLYFPISELTIQGAMRTYVHEYPRTPGGRLELLGRRPYTFRVVPVFEEGIASYDQGPQGNGGVPLYPDVLDRLQMLFEGGRSAKLIVPTMGAIDAVITMFSRRMAPAQSRSGEAVELELMEDMAKAFESKALLAPAGVRAQMATLEDISAKIKELEANKQRVKQDLFGQLQSAVDSVLAIQDQVGLGLSVIEGKIRQVTNLCAEIDRRVAHVQDAENWELVEAVKELWFAHVQLAETVSQQNAVKSYEVPSTMTIQEVSMAVYGATNRSFELLQINVIEDPLAVPPGTNIRYFDTEEAA